MSNVLFETLTLGRLLSKAKEPFLSMRQTNPFWEPNQIIKFQGDVLFEESPLGRLPTKAEEAFLPVCTNEIRQIKPLKLIKNIKDENHSESSVVSCTRIRISDLRTISGEKV